MSWFPMVRLKAVFRYLDDPACLVVDNHELASRAAYVFCGRAAGCLVGGRIGIALSNRIQNFLLRPPPLVHLPNNLATEVFYVNCLFCRLGSLSGTVGIDPHSRQPTQTLAQRHIAHE